MAKKAKPNAGSVDAETRREFEQRHEELVAELDVLKSDHMNKCKGVREEIKDLFTEAKERGIVLKPFKARLKVLGLRRKIDKVRDDLEADDLQVFDYYDTDEDDAPPQPRKPGKKAAAEQKADKDALDDFENGTYQ